MQEITIHQLRPLQIAHLWRAAERLKTWLIHPNATLSFHTRLDFGALRRSK